MSTIIVNNKQFEIFIDAERVQNRIKELAAQIELDYEGKEVCFVSVLNGALYFTSDLMLNYPKPCTLQTVKCKSYEGLSSTGKIEFQLPFNDQINNKHVILLEDIIDTGTTLNFLLEEIKLFHPTSVKICTLLLKPDALTHPLSIDYVGFEIPNAFVLGYGLDYDGLGRNYKDIYKII
ncbi:MAG: hypoxanthine phosphoribosyltransferase [Sphingobacteriales bacterium]|jgi:hypoxanthine phosphoribosyltransferase|nr:hypoxanthine phosphoribosyltransferase [Sphingobacteriales bacterium]